MGKTQDTAQDNRRLLQEADHMRDMERLELEVIAISHPFAGVARVLGRIDPTRPALWAVPNVAVRLEIALPGEARPASRVYTIRSFDAARREVEIDFVLHPDDSPAMLWLRAARPGSRLPMTGPRPHFVPAPQAGKRVALFADETAIPAVYAILRAWPQGTSGTLWIETPEPGAVAELPQPKGVTCHLLQRRPDEPPGTTGRLLAAAQTELAEPRGWTVWAAGERQEMRSLRSHFQAQGLGRKDLQVIGYWRRGTSNTELDEVRLAAYADLRARGLTLDDLSDADLPI